MASPIPLTRRLVRAATKFAVVSGMYAYAAGYYGYMGVSKLLGGSPAPFDHADRAPLPAFKIRNMGLEPIQHFRWNDSRDSWAVVDEESTRGGETVDETKLHIVAYNVLSSPSLDLWTCETVRWTHILDVVLPNSNADVFLLTEVSETFWHMARERDWIRRSFYITDYHFNNGPRNNVILSRVPLYQVCRETKGERRSVVARIGLSDDSVAPLWTICTHIHALYNGHLIRRNQLEAMYGYVDSEIPKDHSVLIMGDLNFHDERENENIKEPFYDVYRSLHPVPEDPNVPWTEEQLGITFDAERNPFVHSFSFGFCHRMRLDRAFLRPAAMQETSRYRQILKPASMRIFSKEPVSPSTPDLLPSDHYALELILEKSEI